jgi:hypothetical protein
MFDLAPRHRRLMDTLADGPRAASTRDGVDLQVLWQLVNAGLARRIDVDGHWQYKLTEAGERERVTKAAA